MNKSGMCLMAGVSAALLIGTGNAVYSADSQWQGYVIDRQCAGAVRKDSDASSFVQRHSKDCSLMAHCQSVGYCLYSRGKWLDLDKKGNGLAIKLLQATKRKYGLYVEAAGVVNGSVLKVQSLKEISEPDAPEGQTKH